MTGPEAILAQPLCALAFCWRLERRDGVTLGLTSHDRAIDVHGLRYEPTPGIIPAAILRSTDSGADVADVIGALEASAISAADLAAGRWDGASLFMHLTEWTAPGALWLSMGQGTIGTVEEKDGRYTAALLGVASLFDRPACPETSPTCRAELGDRDCRIDLRPRQHLARTHADGDRILVPGLDGAGFRFGSIRWLTGPAAGQRRSIMDGGDGFVALTDAVPADIEGALALLTEGCDKRLATCTERFANAANFRGEPHLPGNDLLTRYPGA